MHIANSKQVLTTGLKSRRASGPDRGTALVLIPTCFLVVIGLSAVAVDGAIVHSAQRRLAAVCAASADDAAGMLDERTLHSSGVVQLDPLEATRMAQSRLRPDLLPGPLVGQPTIHVDAAHGTVDVEASIRLNQLIFRAMPGATRAVVLRCHSRGRLRR